MSDPLTTRSFNDPQASTRSTTATDAPKIAHPIDPIAVETARIASTPAADTPATNDAAEKAKAEKEAKAAERKALMDEAESALESGDYPAWIATLNKARASQPGLGALTDPGIPSQRQDLMHREKTYWDAPGLVRVRVTQGFQGAAPEGEPKPIHLPGAVIEMTFDEARIEVQRNRVVQVGDDEGLVTSEEAQTAADEKAAAEKQTTTTSTTRGF